MGHDSVKLFRNYTFLYKKNNWLSTFTKYQSRIMRSFCRCQRTNAGEDRTVLLNISSKTNEDCGPTLIVSNIHVGNMARYDLLIWRLKNKIKRSQPRFTRMLRQGLGGLAKVG